MKTEMDTLVLFSDTTGRLKMGAEECSITDLPFPLQLVAHKHWRVNFGTMLGFLASYEKMYGLFLRRVCTSFGAANAISSKLEAAVAGHRSDATVLTSGETVGVFLPWTDLSDDIDFRKAICLSLVNASEDFPLNRIQDITEEDFEAFLSVHQMRRWDGGIARRWDDAEKLLLCFREKFGGQEAAEIYVYVALNTRLFQGRANASGSTNMEQLRDETAAAIEAAAEEIRARADEAGLCYDPDDLVRAALCTAVPDRWEYAPFPDYVLTI